MNTTPSHEPDRIDGRRLALLGAIFAVVLALVLLLVYLLWHPMPPAPVDAVAVPPSPRLQPDPRRDFLATRQAQRDRLQSYGWDDPGHRYAHVPVQRAMAVMTRSTSNPPPGASR